MDFSFDSAANPAGYKTRLSIDSDKSTLKSIQLINGNTKVFEFPMLNAPICKIQFQRYDLEADALIKKDANGKLIEDIVNYIPQAATVSGNKLVYDAVLPEIHLGAPIEPTTFDSIKVEISFSAANQNAEDQGWIDIDVAFTFPSQFANAAYTNKQAWQLKLFLPQIRFDVSMQTPAMADNVYIKDWSVLFPQGDVGRVENLSAQLAMVQDPLVQDMPVQYAALYRTTDSYVRGIAVSATDTLGGEKAFAYERSAPEASVTPNKLYCHTIFPMHLSANRYVRPSLPNDPPFHFRLSQGDNYGFGGGKMYYRVKAFHVDKATPSAAPDWRDVANIYRKWVKANRPEWFEKANPPDPTGPIKSMSPFTVITNYGIDGPVAPLVNDPELLSKWLEIHPIKVDGKTDMPASPAKPVNDNESLQEMLIRIKKRVNTEDDKAQLEAQIWGYEPGGYYHYIGGYPPVTNLLHGPTPTANRFKKAMDELVAAKIIPIFTSDLMKQMFNGGRYRGHLVLKDENWDKINNEESWNEAIPYDFPNEFVNPARNPNPCKFRIATKYHFDPAHPDKFHDLKRVFIIKKSFNPQGHSFFDPQPNCPEAELLAAAQIYNEYGLFVYTGLLGGPLYQRLLRMLCPTTEVLDNYLATQLSNGALKYGARLIEYMKPAFKGCYFKGHKHIFDNHSSLYDNVIGYGSQATARRQEIFKEIQKLARKSNPRFALSHEGATLEPLLPFYEEFYHSSPVFHFVYSQVISVKMTLAQVVPYVHSGYKEKRRKVNNQEPTTLALPDKILDPLAENAPVPPPLVRPDDPAVIMPLPNPARTASFNAWRDMCVEYFNTYMEVMEYGLAPKSYPTGLLDAGSLPKSWKAATPLAPTNPPSFTYIRCVQDLFNLRYWIYLTGEKAVTGERVYLHANWFEKPGDYNNEAIVMAVRAAQLQMRFANFFRNGIMLGKTAIKTGNKFLWVWKAGYRYFDDVMPLAQRLSDTEAPAKELIDFLTLGTDKEYIDKKHILASVVGYDKIQHMIWQIGSGDSRKILYVFANVGNGLEDVRFNYSRGLEGISSNISAPSGWEKVITLYSNEGVKQSSGGVWLDSAEKVTMKPRTVAGIEIRKTNHAQFVKQTAPKTMKVNQQYSITIQMKNVGASTWTATGKYKLGLQSQQNNQTWGINRVALGAAVAPDKEKVFQFTVKAPATPGIYNFQWQMVQESVEWFGNATPNVSVTVT